MELIRTLLIMCFLLGIIGIIILSSTIYKKGRLPEIRYGIGVGFIIMAIFLTVGIYKLRHLLE